MSAVKETVQRIYSLSPTQQGMLYHTLQQPESGAYVQQMTVALHGPLNFEHFQAAWQTVVERHAVLRSAFLWDKLDQPVQVVQSQVELNIEQCDWSAYSPEERAEKLAELLLAHRRAGFELHRAPLARFCVVRENTDRHRLVWSYHHLLLDGWSLARVLAEVFSVYEGLNEGRAPTLGPSRPFADYVAWRGNQNLSAARAFWKTQLSGVNQATPLGIEYTPSEQPPQYREDRIHLSRETTLALQRHAQQQRVTVSVLVHAMWGLLLSRYADTREIVIGSTVSGRPPELTGVEEMVGLFINTIPLRLRIDPDAKLSDWLRALHDRQVEMRQFEYLGLSEIHAASDCKPGRPLFESLVVFENYPVNAADLSSASIGVDDIRFVEQTHYPLTVVAFPGERLGLGLAYDGNCIERSAVESLLRHFGRLFESYAENPDARLGELVMLDERERRLAINRPAATAPTPTLVPQAIEEIARRSPDAVAIVSDAGELSYRDLDRRANALANALRKQGVQADDCVAICLQRSANALVAMLGIWKVGAAYLPLDPGHPGQRLQSIVEIAQAKAVVFDATTAAVAEALTLPRIDLEKLDGTGSDRESATTIDPGQLAYVIFTSGSTGTPKGVMVTHASLAAYTAAMAAKMSLTPNDRVLEFAPISFDASIVQMFPALRSGAQLHIYRDVARLSNDELLALCVRDGISVLDLPAAFWQQWLYDLSARGVRLAAPLRYFLTGGESCSRDHVRLWADMAPAGAELLVSYGPTETTVAATTFETSREHAGKVSAGQLPLGRPVADAAVYVLNDRLEPAVPGCGGAVYIGGEGLARGYLGSPGLTASRFLPDPYATSPGARMYCSGDNVSLKTDGELQFCGRQDDQVKIRGVRVGLREVESALEEHRNVRDAVVTWTPAEGRPVLAAYVVFDQPDAAQLNSLRAYINDRLPAQMQPSHYIEMDGLPISANGKVDRRALPEPQSVHATTQTDYVAPANEIERVLAQVWEDVLQVPQVGRNDNFFDLGGHSLLATQLVSRVNAYFNLSLPLARLFETNTLASLADEVANLRSMGALEQVTPIPRLADSSEAVVLSAAQKRLWFLEQLDPGTSAFNLPTLVEIDGELDSEALRLGLQRLIGRHDVLRTVFLDTQNGPRQSVRDDCKLVLPVEDLRALGSQDRQRECDRIAAAEGSLPFDLENGPLLRARLVHLEPQRFLLLITMHHIVSDGWSMGVLIEELAAHYGALVADDGEGAQLPPLPLQYRDYAAWQEQWLTGPAMQPSLDYWQRQLTDLPESLDLPLDRPRVQSPDYRGERIHIGLGEGDTAALKAMCRKERVTLFMMVLAAFKTLLFRHTGQTDIVIGSPVANRTHPDTEKLIGFFLNTLALRTRFDSGMRFRELLDKVRETALGAYAHQHVPFERLLEALRPDWGTSASPVFQAMLNMQNFAEPVISTDELKLRGLEPTQSVARFDLNLFAEEHDGELRLDLVYSRQLFDDATARGLLEHLRRILRAVVADPTVRLRDILLLEQGAGASVVTQRLEAVEAALSPVELFDRQVEKRPHAPAIGDGPVRWTYAELQAVSCNLAREIAAHGVRKRRVALLLPHGHLQVAAILAVLRSGNTYVPLDPAFPQSRLEYMLDDCDASLIVTADVENGLAAQFGATIPVVGFRPDPLSRGALPERVEVDDDVLAYVLYTSGSTGQPKGVMQSLRNVCHHALSYANSVDIVPEDRLSLLPSYSFDAAVMDIFGALSKGASLHPFEVKSRGVAELGQWLRHERISVWHSTPSVYRYVAQSLRPNERFADVRVVVLGGEQATPADVQVCREIFTSGRFVNGYGPTESTMCLQHHIRPGDPVPSVRVPIGRPVRDTDVLLLDSEGRPFADVGVGEIAIRSRYVAHGYNAQPELTAEVFSDDSLEPGVRVYRTGDIGRRLSDDRIEHLGRKDSQVKIRGFRIEIAEIEMVLMGQPDVRAAVVECVEDGRGEDQLAAYIVPAGDMPAAIDLRQRLLAKLPDYMVPSFFVALETLPLGPTGKLQRERLPGIELRVDDRQRSREPRNSLEQTVASAFEEVIGRDGLSVDDDFFVVGGHSLLATQLVSRLSERLGQSVPLRLVFDHPTIETLAGALENASGRQTAAISADPGRTRYPLSSSQQRLWFLDQLNPGNAAYTIPMTVELRGDLDYAALRASIQTVVDRHESLRTVFEWEAGAPVQRVQPTMAIDLAVEDLTTGTSAGRRARAEEIARLDAARPFDLARGPLVRARLLKLDAQRHFLLLCMHHIVTDGWSMGVLVSELVTAYRAVVRDVAPALPALPVQYGNFAVWQNERLAGDELDSQRRYWQAQLADLPEPLSFLPRRNRAGRGRGARFRFKLSPEVSRNLRVLAERSGATSFMMLFAAFQVLLYRLSGERDFVVGTPIANRNRAEIESLIGFFVNTLPLRADLSDNPSFSALLERTRKLTLDAYTHQDLPFEQLVKDVAPDRDINSNPLFETFFGMIEFPNVDADAEIDGLEFSRLDLDYGFAMFDLSLFMSEDQDGYLGTWLYDADAYDEDVVVRATDTFLTLLDGLAANPERAVASLPLVGQRERALVIEDWNATDRDYAQGDSTLPGLIWSQGQRTPEATAVIDGDRELSYAQLLSRADGLACELSRRGVSSNDVVAVCAQRSAELAIGLLAVMRAGATYLPLDPQLPDRRIEQMVSDSASVAIVADESLEARVAGWSLPVVSLQGDYPAAAGWQAPAVTGEMGAYLIYTSGSTGVPKGVLIEHRGIVNRLLWMQARFGLEAGDRVLQKTPYGFDVSVWEFFWPLLNGATLVMARAGGHGDPQYLVEAVQRHAITTMHFVPSMLSAFLGTRPPLLSSLRRVICSGEALTVDQVQRFNASQSAQLHNLYGPTEASVDVSHWACPREEPLETVPIGYPIANTQLYVLDAALQPLPVGAVGELYIGGVGLARGYHGRGSLTASAFVPNPYGQPGTRLYRSGDRVRLRGDGAIEYLGRVDHQVKIRGFRIETGEIESVLVGHDEVDEAVVVAHEHAGRTVLVGYVVGAGDVEALREHLRARLPDYMVPAQLMRVERLPLTANGKLDRRALPAPQWGSDEQSYQGPRDEREAALVEIWQSVLGLERVGIDDNFFELGGDSIVCVQVVARANEAGLHLTPRQMFEHQSIAALAAVAATTRQVHADQEAVTGPVKLTPIQHWLLDQSLPQPGHWNQAVMLAGEGELDRAALTAALEALYAQHDVLRHRFEVGSKVQEGLAPTDRPLVVQFEDLSDCAAHEREAAIASCVEQAQRSLDLDAGRLLQVCALQWSGQWRLLLVIHHLVVDGVSWRILLEQLQLAYAQRLRDEPIELPAKTTSYQYWAQRLSEHVHEGGFDEQLPYWLEVTGVEALRLPGIAQANVEADAEVAQVRLSAQQTGQLLHEVPEAYNTNVQDLLLAAVAGALLQWTDTRQAPVLIDLEGHGREDLFDEVDLSRTVGWFTTLYPVCIAAAQSDDPGEALRRVKETLRAVPDRGIGYGALRYLGGAGPAARLAGRSAAQISFNYLGVLDHVLDRDGTFAVAPESTGAGRDPKAARAYELDFSADVSAGRLQLRCHYTGKRFTRSSIERLLELATQGAAKLIAHCIDPDTGAYTPSDFPMASLDQEQLDAVLTNVEFSSGGAP